MRSVHDHLSLRGAAAAVAGILITAPALAAPASFDGVDLARDASGRLGKPAVAPFTERMDLDLAAVPQIVLGEVDEAALRAEDAAEAQWGAKSLRVSVPRYELFLLRDGAWYDVPGGRLWAIDITLLGARGQRLHLTGLDLPDGAELFAYAPGASDEPVFGPVTAHGPGVDPGVCWTTTLPGDTARVEYFVPDGAAGGNRRVPFAIDEIQHVYRDYLNRGGVENGAGACHNDPACFPEWDEVSDSVALVSYVSGGFGFVCSGQLINTVAGDLTPYFLIANHCIATASEAASATFRFRNQRLTCEGSVSSGTLAAGSTIVSTSTTADETLLMVNGELPSFVTWSGWLTERPPTGTASTCIHHPSGSYKRISFATMTTTPNCGGSALNFCLANWNSGVTEGGSSGSGFWQDSDQRLYGTLTCGGSDCATPFLDDSYGRFDRAYLLAFSPHLEEGSDDVLEDNDSCAEAVPLGKGTKTDLVVKSLDEDWYAINVLQNATLHVDATFADNQGDIDIELYGSCGGAVLASGVSNTSNESLLYTNPGATADFYLRVFLDSDTRNDYALTIAIDPPLIIGACCVGDSCFELSAANCAASAGTYQGDDTTCSPDPCIAATGSCCIGAACLVTTAVDCANFGGSYGGDFTTCTPDPCGGAPTGTCCVGDACSEETAGDCAAMGGTYGGDGTTCGPDTCTTPCPADVTGAVDGEPDGNVDSLDFLRLISQWGSPCTGTCDTDITGPMPLVPDGNVDSLDYLLLISQWGTPGNC